MIGRRKSPDGMPFRLYRRDGKFVVTFFYKMPDNTIAFKLSAKVNDPAAISEARAQAIKQADELNGNVVQAGTVSALIEKYFTWQRALKRDDARRKANSTLDENEREAKNLDLFFGKMPPAAIKPKHVYAYLTARADNGAPAKANKEIALLSAVMEYARRRGEIEVNPCRDIQYNPTKARTKLVEDAHLAFAIDEARKRGGQYLVMALCFNVAYLTTSRPEEMRTLTRAARTDEGLKIPVGKRKADQAPKFKIIQWSPALRAAIDEALTLQKTTSMLIFGNTSGQVYSRSGWTTIWSRLMGYCEERAKVEGVSFERFALRDMRPKSVTERVEAGEVNIINVTGHADERMIRKTYDRNVIKKGSATK